MKVTIDGVRISDENGVIENFVNGETSKANDKRTLAISIAPGESAIVPILDLKVFKGITVVSDVDVRLRSEDGDTQLTGKSIIVNGVNENKALYIENLGSVVAEGEITEILESSGSVESESDGLTDVIDSGIACNEISKIVTVGTFMEGGLMVNYSEQTAYTETDSY
jgi:hypothetical protein